MKKMTLAILGLTALVATTTTSPREAKARSFTKRWITTVGSVEIHYKIFQELKDQYRVDWQFINNNSRDVKVRYKVEFNCPVGKDRSQSEQSGTVFLDPHERTKGQWSGHFTYPCEGVPPTSAWASLEVHKQRR